MMNGQQAPKSPVLIDPYGVIHRKSTDTSFLSDPLVSQSIRYIRDNMSMPLQVVDLQKQFGVSRRKLEHRFEKAIGRSPATEIRTAKLGYAKRMLLETDLPIHEISELCGFNHTEVFMRSFKREFGMSPGDFRRSQ
jgi:LacI family transcriptional regulator